MRSLSLMAVLHLAANAVLLTLGYYWLGIGESRIGTLIWSGFLAIFFALFAGCAYAAALAYFRDASSRGIGKAWRSGLRNVLPFLLAAATIAVMVFWLNGAGVKPHPGIKARTPQIFTQWAAWFGEWVLLPVLLLPMLSAISERGWRGFRAAGSKVTRWLFWIEAPILLLLTVRVPLLLLGWIPRVQGFSLQATSFAARASLAYLLFGAGWLVLAFVSSAGSPRLTQSSTADSP